MVSIDRCSGAPVRIWGGLGMTELPAGTVTLLLGDGSPQLSDARFEATATASQHLDRAVSDLVSTHHGVRPVHRPERDGFLAAFACASDAVACAAALQQASLALLPPVRLRVGIHTGEAEPHDGAGYAGEILDQAAWLCDLAHCGQTLLSGVTRQLVADQLPADVWLIDLGRHARPGGSDTELVVQLCQRDLSNEFPPLRRTPEPVAGGRLPVQLTSFVGREKELTQVCELMRNNRLVTLTGAGGVGKSRLAAQLAARLADGFADGMWWVDLTAITDPSLAVMAVARTLGLPDQPGRSTLDILARYIADQHMLIVLDNCEHLLDACTEVAGAMLGVCKWLTILATSREPLGVAGEVTWRTPSLSVADEAVELFTQRARLSRPGFVTTADNAPAVTEICSRLDGVPLAIELAAARVRSLSLTEIVDGLHDRFRLLTGGARTAVARQQTLRASVDWSHDLLSEPERVLFRRLAVFLGGFDLDAAHAVAGGADVQRYQILDELTLLVDKSLVVADDTGNAMRYRLLETVRQYALQKLGESGEADTIRTRHRDHYTALAALLGTPGCADESQCAERARAEINNLRAAFAWSQEICDIGLALQLASSLQPLWLQGRVTEGLAWFNAVLTDDPAVAPAARARALADKVILDAFTGAFGQTDQAELALEIARELDDPALLARVLAASGATCAFSTEVAARYFEEAIDLARALGDDWRLSQILAWRSLSAHLAGDPIAAYAAGEEGRDLADAIGDGFISRMCRWNIGLTQWMSADLQRAVAVFRDVETEAQAVHDPLWRAYGLFGVGKALAYQGDTDGARRAAKAAIEVAADITGVQQAMSLGALVDAALAAGDAAEAVTASKLAWEMCPQPDLLGSNVYAMAQAALAAGDLPTARRWADDAVAAASGGHRMILLATRVRVAIAQGDLEQANRDAYDALTIAAETRAYLTIPDVVECLATLAADSGYEREAARLFGAAQGLRERTGQVRYKIYDDGYTVAIDSLRNAMGDSEFATAWAEGSGLSAAEAIAYAQRGRCERKRSPSGWPSLTPTELDIVRLVSEGLTNKDVGAKLFISPRTVQTHLTHVYTKLGISSRVQLAQEAARHTRPTTHV